MQKEESETTMKKSDDPVVVEETFQPAPQLHSRSQAFAFLQAVQFAQRIVSTAASPEEAARHLESLEEDTHRLVDAIANAERSVNARLASSR